MYPELCCKEVLWNIYINKKLKRGKFHLFSAGADYSENAAQIIRKFPKTIKYSRTMVYIHRAQDTLTNAGWYCKEQ